jgi:hypothetical protein
MEYLKEIAPGGRTQIHVSRSFIPIWAFGKVDIE